MIGSASARGLVWSSAAKMVLLELGEMHETVEPPSFLTTWGMALWSCPSPPGKPRC